jgi:hypothetical protein
VGPRAGLDGIDERKFLHLLEIEHQPPSP